uniref:Selenoprotein P N-terminal domain-containing protein n=1 Tax=Pseudonaja textilis TaxID=8673 RepID=A0A670XRI2_PSETE
MGYLPPTTKALLLGLVIAATVTEGVVVDNQTRICQPAPRWKINGIEPMAGMEGQVTVVVLLKAKKLSGDGMANVSFIIVNEKTPSSRAMYWELKRHAPKGIPVFQQQILEPDVWQILLGNKDDFLIYDRCRKLTFHIQLPYSFLHLPYVEAAVRYTSRKDYCGNCSWYYLNSSQEVRV